MFQSFANWLLAQGTSEMGALRQGAQMSQFRPSSRKKLFLPKSRGNPAGGRFRNTRYPGPSGTFYSPFNHLFDRKAGVLHSPITATTTRFDRWPSNSA